MSSTCEDCGLSFSGGIFESRCPTCRRGAELIDAVTSSAREHGGLARIQQDIARHELDRLEQQAQNESRAAEADLRNATEATWLELEEMHQAAAAGTKLPKESIESLVKLSEHAYLSLLAGFTGDLLSMRSRLLGQLLEAALAQLPDMPFAEVRRVEYAAALSRRRTIAIDEPERRVRDAASAREKAKADKSSNTAAVTGALLGVVVGPMLGWTLGSGGWALLLALVGLVVVPVLLGKLPGIIRGIVGDQVAATANLLLSIGEVLAMFLGMLKACS